jgi:5-methylcytosine-specific restriction endonuclease McrA
VLYAKPLDKFVEATFTLATGGSERSKQAMSYVFVIDANRKALNPVHPGYARLLLTRKKAAVFRRYPFTIILKDTPEQKEGHPLRLKIDPGSQTTGLALVNDATGQVIFALELSHRADAIKKALERRRAVRRGRRQRKTRYRKPRFKNRTRPKGWMAPSLESRVANVLTWVKRLIRTCPVEVMSLELVKFDLQQMEQPEISGVEYQQGTLFGYELRQYLLEKWDRACSYCGIKEVPLQVEHIQAKANGGTDRVSNLTLACDSCNKAKGRQDIRVFLADKPELLARILAQAKVPRKDVAAVNTSRWALYERLKQEGLPLECGSGGLTKFNRTQRNLPKAHWIDAACVGTSTAPDLQIANIIPLSITATGHGNRQKCNVNEIGFPCSKPKGAKKVKGFQTGGMVKAVVSTGTKQGIYVGRVLVRATGSFDIRTRTGRVQGISHRFCTPVHRCDGYSYKIGVRYADHPTQATA